MKAVITSIEGTGPQIDGRAGDLVGLILRDPNKEVLNFTKSMLSNKNKVYAVMMARSEEIKKEPI